MTAHLIGLLCGMLAFGLALSGRRVIGFIMAISVPLAVNALVWGSLYLSFEAAGDYEGQRWAFIAAILGCVAGVIWAQSSWFVGTVISYTRDWRRHRLAQCAA